MLEKINMHSGKTKHPCWPKNQGQYPEVWGSQRVSGTRNEGLAIIRIHMQSNITQPSKGMKLGSL